MHYKYFVDLKNNLKTVRIKLMYTDTLFGLILPTMLEKHYFYIFQWIIFPQHYAILDLNWYQHSPYAFPQVRKLRD